MSNYAFMYLSVYNCEHVIMSVGDVVTDINELPCTLG